MHFSLEFRLPLLPLLGAVGLSALINLVLSLGFAATTRLTERSAALLLGYDILQLAFLLGLTGGLQNPFSILLIVPVTLSATTLSLRTTVVLCVLVIAAATRARPVPDRSAVAPGRVSGCRRSTSRRRWLALVLGTALIAGYAWRIADEARRLSEALAATQMALAREQQLSALGGLAAAAAHELGSPLATIAVTARELANSVPPDSPLTEDVAELVSQSQRCREILQVAQPAARERRASRRSPACRSRPCSRPWPSRFRRRSASTLDVAVERRARAPEPPLVPTPELRHALANLIDNARAVRRAPGADHRRACRAIVVVVRIEDDGPGFSPEVLELLGEPYVSTRPRPAASASACSSRRPCLREPVRRCNLPISTGVPG